jgi:hypothetical protein
MVRRRTGTLGAKRSDTIVSAKQTQLVPKAFEKRANIWSDHRRLHRNGIPAARNLGVIIKSIAEDLDIKPRVEFAGESRRTNGQCLRPLSGQKPSREELDKLPGIIKGARKP